MDTTTETTTEVQELPVVPNWGITPPAGVVAAWGARAIYTENRLAHEANYTKRGQKRKRGLVNHFDIDLCWDRQGAAGRNGDLEELSKWLNAVALKRLAKECSDRYITRDCEEWVEFTDGRFTLKASPRASYGYLYIGAWVLP